MPKKKEQIKFMSLSEIVDYAIQAYPSVEFQTRDTYGAKTKNTVRHYIERKLIQHHLLPGHDQNRKDIPEDRKADEERENGEKKVSEIIAKFIIDEFVYPHYKTITDTPTERIKEKFEKMDEQTRYENFMAFQDFQDYIISTNGSVDNVEAENKHSDDGGFHLPDVCFDDYSPEFEDRAVQDMKIFFFNECYDFHEKEYRRDLARRSSLIDDNDPWFTGFGYEELTWKLEHPYGNYIFPKKS